MRRFGTSWENSGVKSMSRQGLMHRNNKVWHQEKRASVDDLICSHQHCWRYCQTECFHRLLINDETEAGWLFEWQIAGARPS